MLELGISRPSKSACSSPLWSLEKWDCTFQSTFDGRKWNEITDLYPMLSVDSMLNKLKDALFSSTIDLEQALFSNTSWKVLRKKQLLQYIVRNQIIEPLFEYILLYFYYIIVATPDLDSHVKVLETLANNMLTRVEQKFHFLNRK